MADVQKVAHGVYRITTTQPEAPGDLRRNRFTGVLVNERNKRWELALKQAGLELDASSARDEAALEQYRLQLAAVQKARASLQKRIADLRDQQVSSAEAAAEHNSDANNQADRVYASSRASASRSAAEQRNIEARRYADAQQDATSGSGGGGGGSRMSRAVENLPDETAQAVKQAFVSTRPQLLAYEGMSPEQQRQAQSPVQQAFDTMRTAMAQQSGHLATDDQRDLTHLLLFEQMVGDLRDRTGMDENEARLRVFEQVDNTTRQRIAQAAQQLEAGGSGGRGGPGPAVAAPVQTGGAWRPDVQEVTPTDRSAEIADAERQLASLNDPLLPQLTRDTDLIGRARGIYSDKFGAASPWMPGRGGTTRYQRGQAQQAATRGLRGLVDALVAEGMTAEQALDQVLRRAGVRREGAAPAALPGPTTAPDSGAPTPDPVARALQSWPDVPVNQLQTERVMVRDRARAGELRLEDQLRAERLRQEGAPPTNDRVDRALAQADDAIALTRTPQQRDKLAKARAVEAGAALAKRPRKLQRLVSNTEYGQHVARLHRAARGLGADYDPKQVQQQVIKAYGDPKTQQRALELLVALDVAQDHRQLAGQPIDDAAGDHVESTPPGMETDG